MNREGGGEGGEGFNLDQTGMCHRHLKFITLFWSGKTQKVYPAVLEPRNYAKLCIEKVYPVLEPIKKLCKIMYRIVSYRIVSYRIVLYCIYCIVLYCVGDKDHIHALLI